jgi:hypothetical protein
MNWVDWVVVAASGASALACWTFVVLFAASPWWTSPIGRHTMWTTALIGFVLTWSLLRMFFNLEGGWRLPSQVALVLFAAVMWQRVFLLVIAQREGRTGVPRESAKNGGVDL